MRTADRQLLQSYHTILSSLNLQKNAPKESLIPSLEGQPVYGGSGGDHLQDFTLRPATKLSRLVTPSHRPEGQRRSPTGN